MTATRTSNVAHDPPDARHAAAIVALMALGALALAAMGQAWWCRGGEAFLWSGQVWTEHNSQHLADPYTFTHFLHGVLLYGLLWLVAGQRLSVAWRAVAAMALQVGWELLENTDLVIERYRETTISLNYYGDSVGNSLGDMAACLAGFCFAAVVPVWASVLALVVVDASLMLWIRDSLLLNVVMLIAPIDAIRDWQVAGNAAVAAGVGAKLRSPIPGELPHPNRFASVPAASGPALPALRRGTHPSSSSRSILAGASTTRSRAGAAAAAPALAGPPVGSRCLTSARPFPAEPQRSAPRLRPRVRSGSRCRPAR